MTQPSPRPSVRLLASAAGALTLVAITAGCAGLGVDDDRRSPDSESAWAGCSRAELSLEEGLVYASQPSRDRGAGRGADGAVFAVSSDAHPTQYLVAEGDSIPNVASRYCVSEASLYAVNADALAQGGAELEPGSVIWVGGEVR